MAVVKKTKVEKLENSSVKLTITVDGTQTRTSYNETLKKYAKNVQIKGFRKGHVPTSVLETKFGESLKAESFYNTLEEAVKEALATVKEKPFHASTPTLLDEEKLTPELDKDFKFSVQYDVFPDVVLENYEGIEVEAPEAKIVKADIDAELVKIQEQNAMMIDKTEGTVAKDDSVTIDYSAEGAKAGEDFTFTVGSGYSPYHLDDDVIGLKKGETKEINKTFADDDSDKEIAGKSLKIIVTVKSIKVKDIPALDDELAQDVNEKFNTLADLTADVEKRLNEQLENRKKTKISDQIFANLIEAANIQLPESMIQAELEQQLQQFAMQMGMQPEQLANMFGNDENALKGLMDEWRPSAEKNLKQSLIINKIVEDKNFEVSEEEIEAQYEKLAEQNGRSVSEIKDYYKAQRAEIYLKSEIQSQKAVDLLIEKATVKKGKKISFSELMQN